MPWNTFIEQYTVAYFKNFKEERKNRMEIKSRKGLLKIEEFYWH